MQSLARESFAASVPRAEEFASEIDDGQAVALLQFVPASKVADSLPASRRFTGWVHVVDLV